MGELSETEKQIILNEHNRLRSLVSPTAANMQAMVSSFNILQLA